MIDLRSDTVTRPTPGMLDAMMNASVGDDVFHEDPSVNQLENLCAGLFGMESALFCPSGTMTNQIAIKTHTQPGDEVICEKLSHVYQYEGGGIAFNSGASVRLIDGNRGRITASQVKEIKAVCLENNLKLHLDGARLFNALVARNESCKQYGGVFDTISICLSKGLGTPAGSVLIGPFAFIKKARRIRKVLGGGMRQAGYLAAAGLYALEHHIARLADDHRHATILAEALLKKDFTREILPVETNILIFEVGGRYTAKELAEKFRENGIMVIAISPKQIRMVLHLDISESMVQQILDVITAL
jgi:threonine aldolase